MKIFQITGGFCHWDATEVVPTLADTAGRFAPDMQFAEAPDYVFEGWGYDPTLEGDARFIQPEVPDGWLYDPLTGTFYPEDGTKPSELKKSPEALARENMELKKTVAELEAQLLDVHIALCEMFENSLGG